MAFPRDFRFAARILVWNKGWKAVAVLALTLGLNANIAIFSGVGLVLWPPHPYPGAGQHVYSGVEARDTVLCTGVAALAACVTPAWRAMRVDPARALHGE